MRSPGAEPESGRDEGPPEDMRCGSSMIIERLWMEAVFMEVAIC